MKKIVIILVALIAVLGIAGGVYFFVLQDTGAKEGSPVYYTYELGDSFVTNVKDSEKLFKATVIVVADDKDLAELLKEKQFVLRDTVLFQLRNLTEEDISSTTVQDSLRSTLVTALNQTLEIDNIVNVYFTDFVMQ